MSACTHPGDCPHPHTHRPRLADTCEGPVDLTQAQYMRYASVGWYATVVQAHST